MEENNIKIKNFALIIGAMKCGTTSLFEYLAEHPEICPCKHKEYNFFAREENFSKGFEFYQGLFNWDNDKHKIALQAPTSHTRITHPRHTNAAKNIFDTQYKENVKFKLIYIMRNPLDRIESHYNFVLSGFEQTQKHLTEQVKEEAINTSKYAMQLEEYYKRFSKNSILLLNFDDLQNNPVKILKRVIKFLELDESYKFQNIKTIYNKSSEKRIIMIPGYYFFKKILLVKLILQQIPKNLKSTIQKYFLIFLGRKPRTIKLTSNEKEKLMLDLHHDLQQLKDEYRFDFSSWKIKL